MPNRINSLYNELNLIPIGDHQQITGTNTNNVINNPEGACVLIFQNTTDTIANNCRVKFDGNFATSGQGFRYDRTSGVQIMYLTYNTEVNVWLQTAATFDYQWARPIKGN